MSWQKYYVGTRAKLMLPDGEAHVYRNGTIAQRRCLLYSFHPPPGDDPFYCTVWDGAGFISFHTACRFARTLFLKQSLFKTICA